MENLYREMAELLQKKVSFAVATIFDKADSVPRTTGSKMLVLADGSTIGTIGGGHLEADAVRLAGEAIYSRKTVLNSFNLDRSDAASANTIHGGKGKVLIDFIDADDENNLMIYQAAAQILEQGAKAWIVTVLDNTPGVPGTTKQQCLVKPDKTLIGKIDCEPNLFEELISGPAKVSLHAEAFDKRRFLIEPLRQEGTVYIFGASHLSQRIASLSELVGFRTVVLDDNANYVNRDRFPEPTEIMLVKSFSQLNGLDIDENSYIVIVTRGHLYDKVVLKQVVLSGAGYIGMIGCRSKRDQIFGELSSQGIEKERLDCIYAPIGTKIGGETPEELAVSIVGELIKVRSERENRIQKQANSSSGTCCKTLGPDA